MITLGYATEDVVFVVALLRDVEFENIVIDYRIFIEPRNHKLVVQANMPALFA